MIASVVMTEDTTIWGDINGTHVVQFDNGCSFFKQNLVSILALQQWRLEFTRLTEYQTATLPAGVKAVVTLLHANTTGLGATIAYFYKVIADVNGFIDCSLSQSSFTFESQRNIPDYFPLGNSGSAFDASSGTISYS